jgi:hypothetical protein
MLAGQMEGWFFIAAVLLVGAGFTKVRDPAPTAGALAAVGLPSNRAVVLALGAVEIVAGLAGLVVGGRLTGLAIGAIYAGFAIFTGVALARRLPLQSCGCFGRTDTPASWVHVVANSAVTLGAAWYAVVDGPSLTAVLGDQPLLGFPYLAFVAAGVGALYLLLAELPRLQILATSAS